MPLTYHKLKVFFIGLSAKEPSGGVGLTCFLFSQCPNTESLSVNLCVCVLVYVFLRCPYFHILESASFISFYLSPCYSKSVCSWICTSAISVFVIIWQCFVSVALWSIINLYPAAWPHLHLPNNYPCNPVSATSNYLPVYPLPGLRVR